MTRNVPRPYREGDICPRCGGLHYGSGLRCPYEDQVDTHKLGTCLRFANGETCVGCGDPTNGDTLPERVLASEANIEGGSMNAANQAAILAVQKDGYSGNAYQQVAIELQERLTLTEKAYKSLFERHEALQRENAHLIDTMVQVVPHKSSEWIAEPNNQGWWWHIGTETDFAPFMFSILKSGSNGKMFAAYPDSRWCADIGGMWARAICPAPPKAEGGGE